MSDTIRSNRVPIILFILTVAVSLVGYGYKDLSAEVKELYNHVRGTQQLLAVAVSDISHNRKSTAILFQKGDDLIQRTASLETYHVMTQYDHKNINILLGEVAVLESRVSELKSEVQDLEKTVYFSK